MNPLINPHSKASAINSPAVGLVYDLVIRKTKLKRDEKPYAFSTTGDPAHILVAFPGVAAKKVLFVAVYWVYVARFWWWGSLQGWPL